MKQKARLENEQESRQVGTEQQAQQGAALEFSTPEEMLRHDAEHTTVPPEVARRLKQSTAALPPPSRSWWKRLFRT